ncbi:hypothetical protein ACFYSF_48290 [Streptomyces canus]|uniref:hypothetical protein n=1 Tax=Streptomyces canus TaxID=58343 RepID=UPI00367F6196
MPSGVLLFLALEAYLSPFVRHHINMLGRYPFQLPELPGGLRPLCDPDATDEE